MAPKAISPWPSAPMVMVAGDDQVEVVTIPQVGFDDPPAADEPAVHRRRHVGAPANSLGSRTRL